ncbi:hypothetical protein HPB48_014863 [Haemaphysalis longicornis]|uniref:Uncharacterized protein n=1 Tax=Haemaphysalis longicornis TaxID=44386 RepID=A0A9J6GGQ7_HAELO|nr:hypothetical protein HPB48_014863 [Haemaphysalis longicornis]
MMHRIVVRAGAVASTAEPGAGGPARTFIARTKTKLATRKAKDLKRSGERRERRGPENTPRNYLVARKRCVWKRAGSTAADDSETARSRPTPETRYAGNELSKQSPVLAGEADRTREPQLTSPHPPFLFPLYGGGIRLRSS